MPGDVSRSEAAATWLEKAAGDLRAARVDLGADPPLVEDALFHCRQAVEKAEKAFLVWNDCPFRKVHDLAELGSQCTQADPSIESMCRRAESLSVFATAFRYPGDYEQPPAKEATAALKLAHEVYDAIETRLPK